LVVQVVEELGEDAFFCGAVAGDDDPAALPGHQHGEHHRGHPKRQPPAVRDLGEVRGEERELGGEEHDPAGDDHAAGFVPDPADDDEEQDCVQRERAGHCDPVGRRECR